MASFLDIESSTWQLSVIWRSEVPGSDTKLKIRMLAILSEIADDMRRKRERLTVEREGSQRKVESSVLNIEISAQRMNQRDYEDIEYSE